MSHCLDRSTLDDIAAGGPTSDEAARHLTTCTGCTATLERKVSLLDRVDAVAREWVNATPPPALAAGVLAAIDREPRKRAAWKLRAAVGATAAALALAAGLQYERRVGPASPETIASWRSPTAALSRPSVGVLATPLSIGGAHAP